MYIQKRDIVTFIIFVALFMLFDGCEKVKSLTGYDVIEKETITTTEYITKQQMDSIADMLIANQRAEPQRIIIQDGRAVPVDQDYELTNDEVENGDVVTEVNKYQDTIKLGNGTIYSEIYADKLYGKKFSLATTDTIVNKTTLEKRTIVKSQWQYGFGVTLGLDTRLKDVEATLNYIHKDKFSIGAGLQYDTDPLIHLNPIQRTGVKLKLGLNF